MSRSGVSAGAILRSALRSTLRSRLSATASPLRDVRWLTPCQHGGGVVEPYRPGLHCGGARGILWRRPGYRFLT